MKKRIFLIASIIALAGGEQAAQARAPDPPIFLRGTGPRPSVSGKTALRIGMPLTLAVKEFALTLDEPLGDDKSCQTTSFDYPPLNIGILAVDGKIASLSISAAYGNIPETSYITPEGIRLGSSFEAVKRAYPKGKESVHSVTDNHQYLVWDKPEVSGWLFEFSTDKRVTSISVGNKAIEYYEGCA